jgi:hypothetical protein
MLLYPKCVIQGYLGAGNGFVVKFDLVFRILGRVDNCDFPACATNEGTKSAP